MREQLYLWKVTLIDQKTVDVIAETLPMALRSVLQEVIKVERKEAREKEEPPPVLDKLEPESATIGARSFALRVLGREFRGGATIFWNEAPVPTYYVSPTELQMQVNMETVREEHLAEIYVRDTNGYISDVLPFTFMKPAPGGDADS